MCWAVGAAGSLVVAVLSIAHLPWSSGLQKPVNFHWIRQGVKISGRLLGGTIALWSVTTLDRYLLQHYCGMAAVGIYSFYMSISQAVVTFVDAGVVAPLYPKLVAAAGIDANEYARLRSRFSRSVRISSLVLAVAAALAIQPVLKFVNRPAYANNSGTLWALLVFAVISLASRPASYALYAYKRDNQIVFTSLGGLAGLAVFGPLLTPANGPLGMAIAVCLSMSVITAGRAVCEKRLKVQ
jgi:O-antigen/teichoic acid export membrane protein